MAVTELGKKIESYFDKTCLMGSFFDERLPDNALFSEIRNLLRPLSIYSDTWEDLVKIHPTSSDVDYVMTIAHVGVIVGGLPSLFDRWGITAYICDREMTVADLAAHLNKLPDNFRQWSIANRDGWTVAHTYALRRDMPEDFKDWHLKTKINITVADVQRMRDKFF